MSRHETDVLRRFVQMNDEAPGGLKDARDNAGNWYQSAGLDSWLIDARALTATLPPSPPEPVAVGREALIAARAWIASLTVTDMNEIVADGGITAGMVVGQEAAEQVRRIDLALNPTGAK